MLKDQGILQAWVVILGLRHQGVLMSAIRGCDVVSRDDASKWLARYYRGCILVPHCKDLAKSASFMMPMHGQLPKFWEYANTMLNFHDHLPHHYIMHVVHSAEVLGYKHPDAIIQGTWRDFYRLFCDKLHLNFETEKQLDERLDAKEDDFEIAQDIKGSPCVG